MQASNIIMNLLSLFSIFGAGSCKAQELNSVQHGNFTIQRIVRTERESGSVLNRKYQTSSYLIEYRVLFKGKKIKFPSALQQGSPYNFPWRVYLLADAPTPTLLAGSHNLFLITEESNQVKINRLNHHDASFGSIQWLDSNHGGPGDEIQIRDLQNEDRFDSSMVLKGGRHLLINRFTILDVATLVQNRFNSKNYYEYQGWKLSLETPVGFETAVGFSSVFRQIAFRCIRLDDKIEGRYYTALLLFNYSNDSINVVPFRRTDLRIEGVEYITSHWVKNYFEWNADGKFRLKQNVQPPAWSGKLNFVDKNFINYALYPAKESMVAVFLNFLRIKHQKKESDSSLIIKDETIKQSSEKRYRVQIDGKLFQLTYDSNDLKLIFDRHFDAAHADEYRDMITSIGNSFNEALSQGKHQEHFGTYKGE